MKRTKHGATAALRQTFALLLKESSGFTQSCVVIPDLRSALALSQKQYRNQFIAWTVAALAERHVTRKGTLVDVPEGGWALEFREGAPGEVRFRCGRKEKNAA